VAKAGAPVRVRFCIGCVANELGTVPVLGNGGKDNTELFPLVQAVAVDAVWWNHGEDHAPPPPPALIVDSQLCLPAAARREQGVGCGDERGHDHDPATRNESESLCQSATAPGVDSRADLHCENRNGD